MTRTTLADARVGRRDLLAVLGMAAGASAVTAPAWASTTQAEDGGLVVLAATEAVEPFHLRVPPSALADLRRRLGSTRWPDRETVPDDSQGARLEKVQELCAYWREDYDWRRAERFINRSGSSRTRIDGLGFHFLHIRSEHADAKPMIMTHGWPGSILEFAEVIGPLTDPTAHGGRASDAFHLVIPSLPGYGFSEKPTGTGWGVTRTAAAWATLMTRLGYDQYVAQGGDWGAAVTGMLGMMRPPGLEAIHVNTVFLAPQPGDEVDPSPTAALAIEKARTFTTTDAGYLQQQGTRPQTLGYGLVDSPSGQAAWIYEKLASWSDNGGDVETVLTKDQMLDDIMIYWLTGSGASSARMYWESLDDLGLMVDLPTAVSVFLNDVNIAPREWGSRSFSNITSWNEVTPGGHFAAFEQPEVFVREVRDAFRSFR